MKRLADILLIVGIGLFVAAPALAVKPDKPEATITLDQPAPAYGDAITFTVTATVTPTYVRLTCSQNGAIVLVGGNHFYYTTTYTTRPFGLASPAYPGGAAECVAVVKLVEPGPSSRWTVIGEASFVVAP